MKELKDRLKKARSNAGLTQSKVVEAIDGMTQPSYSGLERGDSKSTTKIAEIAQIFGVNPLWLATGEGEMLTKTSSPQEPLMSYGDPISAWDESTPIEPDEVEIPYYSDLSFACGMGAESVVHEGESRPLRIARSTLKKVGVYKDKTFSAKATGNSMSPIIQDGYTIFVDTGRTQIKDGKIFAISHGGLHSCKILYNLPNGGVRIVSQNTEEYEEIKLTKEQIEQEQFKVIGWVYRW